MPADSRTERFPLNFMRFLPVFASRKIAPPAYPELFALVGGAVPDYRGLFLRGIGGNSAALGVSQGDAIREFNINIPTAIAQNDGPNGGRVAYAHGNWPATLALRVPGETETRPVNKAVRYLICTMP